MSDYREKSKLANAALEKAKERASIYKLEGKEILFKRIDVNGSVRVAVKDMSDPKSFRFVPVKKVTDMGIDINNLPDYKTFSEKYQKLNSKITQLISEYKNISYQEILRVKESILSPYYKLRRQIYDEYMSSPEWSAKRQQCFKVHGYKCIDCGIAQATDIHHRHYDTLGDECPVNDIVPLCSACHNNRHFYNSLMDKPEC